MSDEIINSLQKDIEIVLKIYQDRDESNIKNGIWAERMPSWFSSLLKGSRLNVSMLENFIGYGVLLTEVPSRSKNFIIDLVRQMIRGPGYKKYCLKNYQKLIDIGYQNKFHKYNLSKIGNPSFYTVDGHNINERFLRHVRTVELFLDNIRKNEIGTLRTLDIGGGYSQFAYMLSQNSKNTKVATLDFKEQLILGYYFLKANNPNLRVNTLEEVLNIEIIDKNFIDNYDVVLIPIECFIKIDKNIFNVVCNFSSLGEMPNHSFHEYLDSGIVKNSKYFFTINRLDSWPTYENTVTILDYKFEEYATLHKMISPLWDYFYLSYTKFFIKKIAFKSRNFEFIGVRRDSK